MALSSNNSAIMNMRKWINAVEVYSEKACGTASPYEVSGIKADKDGNLVVTFKLKSKPAPKHKEKK